MSKLKFKIQGMHCASCEVLVERNFRKIDGVEKVRVNHVSGEAEVYCHREPSVQELQESIKDSGYTVSCGSDGNCVLSNKNTKDDYLQIGAIFFVVVAIYLFLKETELIPSGLGVSENMSYWVVFLIGLVAAVSSCLAVVGGLLLAVAGKYNESHPEMSGFQKFKPHIYFNLGRIVSYAVFGALVGWLGSAVTVSPKVNGYLIIFISIVMLMLGFQILRLFPNLRRFQPRMPKFIAHKIHEMSGSDSKSAPFTLGALTFFLPCGFTQALQLYVLTTGDPLTGGLTMMVFALGTLPALLSLSVVSSFAKGEVQKYFLKFAGVIVILLAVYNINNGLNLTGIASAFQSPTAGGQARIVDGKQIVEMKVSGLSYEPANFTVVEGVPVEMRVDGAKAAGCARVLMLPSLGISKYLSTDGITTFTFVPQGTGIMPFSCPMGMTTAGAAFTVVPNTSGIVGAPVDDASDTFVSGGEVQKLNMVINSEQGFYPNEFTIRKGIPVELTIDDQVDLGGCMGTMTIPEYGFAQLISIGINVIRFTPTEKGVVQAVCSMGIPQATFYITD